MLEIDPITSKNNYFIIRMNNNHDGTQKIKNFEFLTQKWSFWDPKIDILGSK